jgi:rubrerythrin
VSVGSLYTWEAELSRISQNDERFKVLVYYGQKRGNEKKDLGSYDLVLTTYGILSGEFASDGNKDLYNFEWHRVVLDEAQYIKGKRIQTTKAIEDLNMQNRWCLTSYSANNRSEDMFNMVNFLKLEPWSCPTWWTAYIGKPLDKGDEDAYEILYTILKPAALVLEDNYVVVEGNSQRNRMPGVEKEERIEWVELSQEEKEFYICLLKKSKAEYDTLIAQDTLTEYYSHAFDLMMKVRQSCDHLFLIYSKFEVKDSDCLEKEITAFLGLQDDDEDSREAHDELSIEDEKYKRTKMHDHFEIIINENTRTEQVFAIQKPHVMVNNQLIHETVERLNMGDIVHCPLCLNDLENVTVTVCGHILCSFCMRKSIEAKSMCPACNTILTRKDCLHISRYK